MDARLLGMICALLLPYILLTCEKIARLGDRIAHPGDRIPHPGDRIPHPGERVPHPGDRIPNPPPSDEFSKEISSATITESAR